MAEELEELAIVGPAIEDHLRRIAGAGEVAFAI
jgi:hypothetical protein